ncbi:MAG TPA: hypothetical protein DCY20_11230 [Firmicutes bacterium]|nr:hypothetical protein [Bacillota bacterium]
MKRFIIGVMLLCSASLVACTNESPTAPEPEKPTPPVEEKPTLEVNYQEELQTLLPSEIGLEQQFNGIAEYGHLLKLQYIQNNNELGIKYQYEGSMNDARGDETTPRIFDAAYSVTKDSIIEQINNHDPYNRLDDPQLLNSIIPNKIVIKAPLENGNTWEEAFEYKGKSYVAVNTLTIKKSASEAAQYEVSTVVKDIENYLNNTYKEVRVFEAEKGMVSFSNLENLDLYDEEYVATHPEEDYYLFGYSLSETPSYFEQLKAILPETSGLVQQYNGLAEYGHITTLNAISLTHGPQMVYQYSGVMNDGMGDNDGSRIFDLKYLVSNDAIFEQINNKDSYNELSDEHLLNSIIANKLVLKAPLVDGNTWVEQFDYQNQSYVANNTLHIKSSETGATQYVVETIVEQIEGYLNQTYKEVRTFEVGKGMTSFKNILPLARFDETYISQHPEEEVYYFGYSLADN